MKIEIDIDLEQDYDFHLKKHNNSKYIFEDLKPALIEYIKYQATYYWMSEDGFFDQDRHEKKILDTIIHNTAFHKEDVVIVKTDEEQPIDKDSVVRLM